MLPPKGNKDEDLVEVIRSPGETRPISLKNTDNKGIFGAGVHRFRDSAKQKTHSSQNGFVPDRNFLNNLIDLDSSARIYSTHFDHQGYSAIDNPGLIPTLPLYDFEAAFPSVDHEWIFLVLAAVRMPVFFINLCRAMYANARAVTHTYMGLVIVLEFLSGVLQGCPGSAFLFNLALDPFLISFDLELKKKKAGLLRACADDIGASLRHLHHLKLLFPIFCKAQEFAGLKLKPKKCNIVIVTQFHDGVKHSVRDWLRVNIPDWSDFNICDAAKLLGFYVGPAAGAQQWVAPLRKYINRVSETKMSGAAVSLCAFTYNFRIVPVLSYVSQLVPLPGNMARIERAALQSVFHIATSALCDADYFNLTSLGGPFVRSAGAAAAAALFRTAACTLTSWPRWRDQLVRAADLGLDLASRAAGRVSPSYWDSPPFVANLEYALNCFQVPPHGYAFNLIPDSLRACGYGRWAQGTISFVDELFRETPVGRGLPSRPGRIRPPLPLSPSSFPPTSQVQKKLYKKLVTGAYPNMICSTLARRVRTLFSPYQILDSDLDFEQAASFLRQLRKHDAMRVVKTWSNAWATSNRYHEAIRLPCLFGCAHQIDAQRHYVNCPLLYCITRQVLHVSDMPLERLAVSSPTRASLLTVACVFSAYHALKNTLATECLDGSTSLDPQQLLAALGLFAESLAAEAVEVGLDSRSFRPDEHFVQACIEFDLEQRQPAVQDSTLAQDSVCCHVCLSPACDDLDHLLCGIDCEALSDAQLDDLLFSETAVAVATAGSGANHHVLQETDAHSLGMYSTPNAEIIDVENFDVGCSPTVFHF